VTFERLPDGKIRATTSSWEDAKVLLPNQVLEVAIVGKQVALVRVLLKADNRGVGFDEGGTHGNARHIAEGRQGVGDVRTPSGRENPSDDKRRPLTGDLPSTPRVSSSAAQLRDAFHRIAEGRQSGVGFDEGVVLLRDALQAPHCHCLNGKSDCSYNERHGPDPS
jgi:hypothetical protein